MLELPNRREDYQLTATLTNDGGGKLNKLRREDILTKEGFR